MTLGARNSIIWGLCIFGVLAFASFVAATAMVDRYAISEAERVFNERQFVNVTLAAEGMSSQIGAVRRRVGQIARQQADPENAQDELEQAFADDQEVFPSLLGYARFERSGKVIAAEIVSREHADQLLGTAQGWIRTLPLQHEGPYAGTRLDAIKIEVLPAFQVLAVLAWRGPGAEESEFVAGFIDLATLANRFIQPLQDGLNTRGFVLTESGTIVFERERELIGRNVYDGLHADQEDMLRMDQRLLAEPAGQDQYVVYQRRSREAVRKLMVWKAMPIGEHKLVVAFGASAQEATAALLGLRIQSIVLGALLAVILLGGSVMLIRSRQRLLEAQSRSLKGEVEARTAKLTEAKDAAELANVAKSRFLATMTHEFRTPLSAVIGFSDLLLEDKGDQKLPDSLRGYARDINFAGRHLLELVNRVLEFTRIEAGAYRPEDDLVDIRGTIAAVLRLSRNSIREKRIRIRATVGHSLPALVGDATALRQILVNLVSNAIKFTPERGRIIIRVECEMRGLSIKVEDSGVGMPEEMLAKVGEPFTQADTYLTRRHEGVGLGLSIVKGLIEVHNGSLQVESEEGRGTTVAVHFPPSRLRWLSDNVISFGAA